MRALVQRVKRARVTVGGAETGAIGPGILVFLGVRTEDGSEAIAWMAKKCAALRIFDDEQGKMNRSVVDAAGSALVVSQFTLYGDAGKGNRPSYTEAARPEIAEPIYDRFCAALSEQIGKTVATGKFAAMMDVELVNDGPVTIWIESPDQKK